MMISFEEFVGALFKDIQPLSNFDIIRICKKLKISNFKSCFMRDEIRNICRQRRMFCNEYWWTAVLLEHIGLLWISMKVQHITSTHLASSRLKRSNNIVRNLDFTIHLNFKNQTKLYVGIYVYISFTECVIVNKIFIRSWMGYTINKNK